MKLSTFAALSAVGLALATSAEAKGHHPRYNHAWMAREGSRSIYKGDRLPYPRVRIKQASEVRIADRISDEAIRSLGLGYYAYSEYPPDKKPANILLEALKGTPVGTPIEEIRYAAEAFGLDLAFMKAVAKIESDFGPTQRTGSYIGLFQLSKQEFERYEAGGEITSSRDNAVAAASKFVTEASLFEQETHRKATPSDLYLIHQQGWQGAAEHVAHPERIAWQSMCATDEGKLKGEAWCKLAIWGNTLPAVKQTCKSVENLTSGAFVEMWRTRVDQFYSRYANVEVW